MVAQGNTQSIKTEFQHLHSFNPWSTIDSSVKRVRRMTGKKRGPKPEYGSTRRSRGIRLTDDSYEWAQTLGGPGYLVEAIYNDETLLEFVVSRLLELQKEY